MEQTQLKMTAKEIRRTEKFGNVLDILAHAQLLRTNYHKPKKPIPIQIDDLIWAGKFEPRIWEVLPAAMIHFPEFILGNNTEFDQILLAIKNKNDTGPDYQFIKFDDMKKWFLFLNNRI